MHITNIYENTTKFLFGIFLVTLITHASATAGDHVDLEDTLRLYHLDPVVVTANKIEVARSNIAASVSVIGRDEIGLTRNESILTAVHTRVPGLFILQRGVQGFGLAAGSAGQIHIRGIGGMPNTRVLVLLDGRPQFMGIFGHPIPDSYLSSHAERVEVIRGPASILYGTNAMGGVMNIITRRDDREGLSAFGSASYGSYNTQNYNTGFGYRQGAVGVHGSYTYSGTRGQRSFSDHYMNSGFLKADMILSERFTLTLDGALTQFNSYDPGPESNPRVNNWIDILRGNAGFALDNRIGTSEGSVRMIYSFGEHDIHDGFHSNDRNVVLLMYQTFSPVGNNQLTVGFDYKYYGGRAENLNTGADFGEHSQNEIGVYVFSQHRFDDRFVMNGGIRIENSDVLSYELVPQIGMVYRIADRTSLRGIVSKGFRSPTMQELYLFPPSNPDLEPERMWNYEIGLLHTFRNAVQLELTGYVADGTDGIRTEGVPPNVRFENSGSFTHRGIEFAGIAPLTNTLLLHASYSYLDPGTQTRSNPRHTLFTELSYRRAVWRLDLQIQHVNRIYGRDLSLDRMNDYTLMNAKVTVRPNTNVSLYVSAENLFNEEYSTIFDYPIRGRLFFTGVNFKL